ncbi:ATPase [Limnohabitans sp. T6-5]|uniref:ATPase n=1 Tax=Limnohabitans sp. T6-5 TaxID=1100724 RepID=UPI0011B23608|nr:ATPase [Limnohabitans sp. T6-5]
MSARRIAIVGAPRTGKTWLTHSLAKVLQSRGHGVQMVKECPLPGFEVEGRTLQADEQLSKRLTQAAKRSQTAWLISDSTPLMTAVQQHMQWADERLYPMALTHQAMYDNTLFMGLDLPGAVDGMPLGGPVDTLLRQALDRAGIAYRVVYGQGHQRLNNALLALGWTGEDDAARMTRENAQFAINQGRTVWQCNECSDPDCEHKLFTGLMERRTH